MSVGKIESKFEARQSNWLPLPVFEKSAPRQTIVEDDFFPKADVLEYFPKQRKGQLVDSRGRRFSFDLDEVELIGVVGAESLTGGIKVGYDVSRTFGGVRITKLKIY